MRYPRAPLAIAAAFTVSLSTSAHAALIETWNFNTSGGFVEGGGRCSNAATGAQDPEAPCGIGYSNLGAGAGAGEMIDDSKTWTRIKWGAPVGQDPSALDISLLNATATVGGGFTTISEITHHNKPIYADSGALASGEVKTRIGVSAAGFGSFERVSGFSFDLLETTNQQSATWTGLFWPPVYACAYDSPYGSVCDDIFDIPKDAFPDFSIRHGGFAYFFEFQTVVGSTTFGDGTIPTGALQETDTHTRIFTGEGAATTVFNQVRITAREVPVPSALPLFGLGFALLALGRRVRREH